MLTVDITHYCSYLYPIVTANESTQKSSADQTTATNFSNTTSLNPFNVGGRPPSTAGQNVSMNNMNTHLDLHGILQKINSSAPLSMSTNNQNHVNHGNGSLPSKTISSSSIAHRHVASKAAHTAPVAVVQPVPSPPQLPAQPQQQQQQQQVVPLVDSSMKKVPPNSYYSHHQQYYHHNHHDHNQQPPYSSVPAPVPHPDIYFTNPSFVPYSTPQLYSYNHQSQSHVLSAPPYMGPYNIGGPSIGYPGGMRSTLDYARSNNIYNFSSGGAPAALSSVGFNNSLMNGPTSDDRERMMDVSPSGTSPNASMGLISVGGFIGGIVDSEQDHYHHSDHYHHCEDEDGSVMYSDTEENDEENEVENSDSNNDSG